MIEISNNNIQIMLKQSFEMATEAIFLVNTEGRVVFANTAACKHLGYEKTEILKLMVWDIDDIVNEKEKYYEVISSFSNKNEHSIIESVHKRKDLKLIPVKISSSIIEIDDENYLISYVSDITEEKEKDKRIKLYFELIKESNEIVFFVDTSTELIEFANNKACDLLGYKLEELKTMKISKIRKAINNDIEIPDVFKKAKKEKALTTLGQYLCKNGNVITVETSLKIKEYKGIEYIIAISRDISDRLELEKKKDELNKKLENYNETLKDEIEKAKKELLTYEAIMSKQSKMAAMGEMLENIAHQWRQPLSVITVLSSGIKLQYEMGKLNKNYLLPSLDDINTSAQYLSDTIEDFSNYFKPTYEKSFFSSKELLDYTLSIVQTRFGDLEFIANIEELDIYTFKNELVQVLINLFNNAIDELVKKDYKKLIFINIYKKKEEIIIEVKDNAGGIKEHLLDRVFEPYFTTKHKSKGTGIGLYMSSELIKKHMDGDIIVENIEFIFNNKTQSGAKFLVSIPFKKGIN